MAYLGTPIDTTNQFQSLQGKRFSGDASTTAFTLDIAPSSVFDIEVFVENVRQDPNSAYGISGTTLTFTGAPPSGTNNIYVVHQAKAVGTIDVPASGVVPASLASNIISGQTELASAPDDTDELLVSDAGTIKRVDVSLIKSTNTPNFEVRLSSNFGLTNDTFVKVTWDSETFDSDSAFASNKFTVPSGKAGKYLFMAHYKIGNSLGYYTFKYYKNGSAVSGMNRNIYNYANSDNDFSFHHNAILDLSASDYIETYVQTTSGSGNNVYSNQSYWQGFKLA